MFLAVSSAFEIVVFRQQYDFNCNICRAVSSSTIYKAGASSSQGLHAFLTPSCNCNYGPVLDCRKIQNLI